MSTRLALLVSIILAIVAAVGVQAWIKSEKEKQKKMHKQVPILVASQYIKESTLLKDDMFGAKYVARDLITADMVHWDERLRYVGKILTRTVPKAEAILKNDITEPMNKLTGGQRILQEGKRAVAIRVSQDKVAGFLVRPGDYVDVLGTFEVAVGGAANRPSGRQTETRTVCLLQGVKVLAVDNRTQEISGRSNRLKTNPYRSITLEVDPDSGARLINAQREGDLYLMLRPRSGSIDKALQDGAAYRWDKK